MVFQMIRPEKLHVGGVDKRWSCMIPFSSPASESHSKVPRPQNPSEEERIREVDRKVKKKILCILRSYDLIIYNLTFLKSQRSS